MNDILSAKVRIFGFNMNGLTDISVPDSYCPVDVLNLCDPFSKLRGCLRQSRISGFPLVYTNMLLVTLFPHDLTEVSYTTPSESAWPPLPTIPATTALVDSSLEISRNSVFEVALSPSLSFAQSFEDEMVKYESSLSDAFNYTLAPGGVVPGSVMNNVNYPSIAIEDLSIPRRYPSIATSYMASDGGSGSSSKSNPQIHFATQELPRGFPLENNGALKLPVQSGCRAGRGLTPSPDTMNMLNEQDPAFLRTLQALHPDAAQASPARARPFSDPIPPKLMEGLPGRGNPAISSLPPQVPEGTKKRYSTFLNRLRGRPISA
jgi:hypothetical protein